MKTRDISAMTNINKESTKTVLKTKGFSERGEIINLKSRIWDFLDNLKGQ